MSCAHKAIISSCRHIREVHKKKFITIKDVNHNAAL